MPATPPVRKAICIAPSRSPPSSGRGRHPDVAADGEPHADVAGDARRRPRRPGRRSSGRSTLRRSVSRGQQEQHEEDDDGEDAEGPELPRQVRRRALLDGAGDLLHLARCPRRRREPRAPAAAATPSATSAMTATTIDVGQVPTGKGQLADSGERVPDIYVLLYRTLAPAGGTIRPTCSTGSDAVRERSARRDADDRCCTARRSRAPRCLRSGRGVAVTRTGRTHRGSRRRSDCPDQRPHRGQDIRTSVPMPSSTGAPAGPRRGRRAGPGRRRRSARRSISDVRRRGLVAAAVAAGPERRPRPGPGRSPEP